MSLHISGGTKILGVIADPVIQARTPAMANELLQQLGLLGTFVLVPMHVSAAGFPAFLSGLRALGNFAGAVVSMPHKATTAQLVDETSEEAKLVGAVNVVRRLPDGRLRGTVLDGEGFVSGLLSAGHRVSGANIVLAGAGGAASAVAFALAKHGCASVCILNRTRSRATSLASRVKAAFPRVQVSTTTDPDSFYDIAVNGTSLGMKATDELPLPVPLLQRCNLIAECVIAPEMTKLLKVSLREGKKVHTGVPMLSSQMGLMLQFMGVQ